MENSYNLFECDLCHDYFDLEQIRLQENGIQYLCDKCAGNNNLNLMDSLLDKRARTGLNPDCGVTIRPKGA